MLKCEVFNPLGPSCEFSYPEVDTTAEDMTVLDHFEFLFNEVKFHWHYSTLLTDCRIFFCTLLCCLYVIDTTFCTFISEAGYYYQPLLLYYIVERALRASQLSSIVHVTKTTSVLQIK